MQTFRSGIRTTNLILAKFARNNYCRPYLILGQQIIFMYEKLFWKIFETNPYFAQNLSKKCVNLSQKIAPLVLIKWMSEVGRTVPLQ